MKQLPIVIILLLLGMIIKIDASRRSNTLDPETMVREMRKSIAGKSLIGKWKLSDNSNFRINSKMIMINQLSELNQRSSYLFDFLSPSLEFRQVQGFFEADEIDGEATGLYLKLYDGKYLSNSTVIMQIELGPSIRGDFLSDFKPESTHTLWQNQKKIFVACLLLRNQQIIGKFSIGAQLQITSNILKFNEVNSSSFVNIKFQSGSFSFYAEMKPVTDEYDNLVKMAALCTGLFLVAVIFFKPKKTVYNLSEWMIVQVAAFVVASNFILLGQSFSKLDTHLWVLAFCCSINIALTLFFLRNYENVVFNQFNNKRKAVFLLLYLVVYLSLTYIFYKNLVFWIYEAFFLLAVQISYSYSMGGRGGMAIKLVLTIIFTRVPFIYYRYYCEVLTRVPNNAKLLFAFIAISIILLAFITLQRYFGSRFLIPKELIPDYHPYFKLETSQVKLDETCSICTSKLREDPDGKTHSEQKIQGSQAMIDSKLVPQMQRTRIQIMVTPCNHSFHPKCLQDWMNIRLNCPMCRSNLPPSEQQRDDSYCC